MSIKIVVVGGTGLIGSKLIEQLSARGYEAVSATPSSGVNTLTGEGLEKVLQNAKVVVDVSNSPVFEGTAVMEFFQTSTRNLLAYEAKAGVNHHIGVSVVGSDRLVASPYMRAKLAQEKLIQESGIPYSIVRATQLFEFMARMAESAAVGNQIRVPLALLQPIAAEDVAKAVGAVATGRPFNGVIEVAGPQRLWFEEFIGQGLRARNDPRELVVDPDSRYFGARLSEVALVPLGKTTLGNLRFEDWLKPAMSSM